MDLDMVQRFPGDLLVQLHCDPELFMLYDVPYPSCDCSTTGVCTPQVDWAAFLDLEHGAVEGAPDCANESWITACAGWQVLKWGGYEGDFHCLE